MAYLQTLINSIKQKESLQKLMHDIILIDYETGNPCEITDLRGAESGETCIVIETKCSDGTKWRHSIITEEI